MGIVAVVERSRTQRRILRERLEEAGHRTLEAVNAAEARHLLSEQDIDAVLLAWELDDTPAPDLLREWQNDPRARFVPVLMVTSHGEPARVYEALSLGAVDFLKKPPDQVELVARSSSALRTRKLQLELHDLATRDSLTGLLNRREFMSIAEQELQRCQRYQRPASLCIVDLDHFKSINDSFGHDAGDEVLRQVARLFERCLRSVDVIGRHGGEEFTVLLPETPAPLGVVGMNRVLDVARQATWLQGRRQVSFSCGITNMPSHESVQRALLDADAALYEAKAQGRAKVVLANEANDTEK